MCRLLHVLCVDSCGFLATLAWLASLAIYPHPLTIVQYGGGHPIVHLIVVHELVMYYGGEVTPPYCTFSVQVVSCVMCSFILSYV